MGTGDGYGDRWWLWGQAVALGAQWPQVVAWGGQKMAMGTAGGFGDRWWLWGHLGGPMWWLWGDQEMAMGTGSGFGGTVALRTNGFGGTVALGMGRLWVQGGFEDGWQHNPG